MSLRDEINKIRDEKIVEEQQKRDKIAELEKLFLPAYAKFYAIELYDAVKKRILDACSLSRKNEMIVDKVHYISTKLDLTDDGCVGHLHYQEEDNNERNRFKLFDYYKKTVGEIKLGVGETLHTKAFDIHIGENEWRTKEWLSIDFFDMFKITKQKGFLKHTYKLESKKIKLLFDEAKALADKDGIKLAWKIMLRDKNYKNHLELSFDETVTSKVNVDFTKDGAFICEYTYEV